MNVEGLGRSRRKWMAICIFAVAAASAVGWLRLRVDSSLEPLLPEGSQAKQTVLFLRDSSFAANAVLWFRLTGSGSVSDLIAAADATEKRLDPRLINRVIQPPSESNAVDQAIGLLDHAGELLDPNDLADLQKATTPEALRKRMREIFVQLVKPQGSFLQQIIRRDPLGVSARILSRLYDLSNGMGFRVEIKNGHFLSSDGRQLILVLETSTTATNIVSSDQLVAHLQDLCAAAPPGIEIIPICGQIHTVQNEQLMRHDVHLSGAINTVVFLSLFLLVSRDWRVGAVFLLPLVTAALTIGLCALVHPSLSTMMVAMTFAMAGSAVDYGIYVYTAVRMGTDFRADMRRIRRPLLISHLTTLGVFVAFTFSKIPAYRQLGYLTSISLVLSLLSALFILPRMLRAGGNIVALGRGMLLDRWGKMMAPAVIAAAILLVAGIFFSRNIKFDSDITRMDGVSASVKQAEKDFQKNWGRTDADLALLVVTAPTRDAAELANDRIYPLIPQLPDGPFVSISSVWPSSATRHANEKRWRAFWSEQRVSKLRGDLAAAGEPYGFSATAFDPFFQGLANPPSGDEPPEIITTMAGQFTARSNGNWQMLSYFDDTPANIAAVRAALRDRPDVQVVSRGVLAQAFKDSGISETHLLVGISVAFIIVSLLALTRSWVKSLIIMLPVLAGLVAMVAALSMMSMSLSLLTVIAAIVVLALTSDYGVFAAYACDGRETILGQGMASVHVSCGATAVGTGVMMFARHPALFYVAFSLTTGLLGGYLAAFFVIPGVCYLWAKGARRGAA
ncbi:MAG: MMPL family transporter [Tepidisphaeraceae bacterium]